MQAALLFCIAAVSTFNIVKIYVKHNGLITYDDLYLISIIFNLQK